MKKNCNIIKDLLPLYIDNVCSTDSKELVEKHLNTCQNCQEELENLKINIKTNKKNEINGFKKFIKKINFKIIRNSILITSLIIAIIIPLLYFYGSYETPIEYDENMRILIHDRDKKQWNFQFDAPIIGSTDAEVVTLVENEEIIHYIFITRYATLQNRVESAKIDGPIYYGSASNLDYSSINVDDNIKVYYTTYALDEIKNSSNKELKEIINNSTLIFDKEITTSTLNCSLYNEEYNYSLTYYKISGQIISSNGDNSMPDELLMNIYSIDGDYKSIWFPGDLAPEIFEKIEDYFNSKRGSCTLEK